LCGILTAKHTLTRKGLEKSKSIAGIVGPTLIVMTTSELKAWNPNLYDFQIIPLVYLLGVLMFIAGISIVRTHNIWVLGWQTCITITGWLGVLLGLLRMFFPQVYKAQFKNDFFAFKVEILLILLGVFLTFKAYWPQKRER
jgi:hypothetical protein